MYDGILNVYKEPGYTSHDVVAKMRGIAVMKKIGHAGTLDPDAEGVLLLCLGKATKQVNRLADAQKTYEAVLLLGKTTDTQDTSGTVIEERSVTCSEEELKGVLDSFLGEQMQIPPMYSAKKVNGKKLYELARQGKTIEREPRPVTFYEIELLSWESPRAKIRVVCSKGTYIRTLCHDVGAKLGCGGCMEHLVRTRIGGFSVDDAHRLSELQAAADAGELEKILLSPDAVNSGCAPRDGAEKNRPAREPGSVVTIGKFDGVHRGHQKLIARVVQRAKEEGGDAQAVVIAFVPEADGKESAVVANSPLLARGERAEMLSRMEVDRLIEMPFSETIRNMSPEEFVREILVGQLHCRAVVIGTDFRFGRERAGDPERLAELGKRYGFEVEVIEKEKDGDRDISSTYVRERLAEGDVDKASELLGYAYKS